MQRRQLAAALCSLQGRCSCSGQMHGALDTAVGALGCLLLQCRGLAAVLCCQSCAAGVLNIRQQQQGLGSSPNSLSHSSLSDSSCCWLWLEAAACAQRGMRQQRGKGMVRGDGSHPPAHMCALCSRIAAAAHMQHGAWGEGCGSHSRGGPGSGFARAQAFSRHLSAAVQCSRVWGTAAELLSRVARGWAAASCAGGELDNRGMHRQSPVLSITLVL